MTLWDVASMFSAKLEPLGKRGFCLFRKHKRKDKTFRTFVSKSGDTLYKCWSCDPPGNIGDAVQLYAMLSRTDRKQAWRDLRDRGYDVPGADQTRPERAPDRPRRKPVIPIEGDKPEESAILPLDLSKWRKWREQRLGAVEKFAASRRLDAKLLRSLDVVDMSPSIVGFGYRDPDTGLPCRVKVRPLDRKTFWVEPRPVEGVNAKAFGPLYLAHDIKRPMGLGTVIIVTEGEVDALTLRSLGLDNVVSLPDGAQSASRVDLMPLHRKTSLLLSATDHDKDGDEAHQQLCLRASRSGITTNIGRVLWQRTNDAQPLKDANDAVLAGFTKDDVFACIQRAADRAMGFPVNLFHKWS